MCPSAWIIITGMTLITLFQNNGDKICTSGIEKETDTTDCRVHRYNYT